MKFATESVTADGKPPAHPEGTWDAKVTGSDTKRAKSGKDMITLTWKTSQGTLRSYHTYSEEYPWFFLRDMYAIGLSKEFFEGDPEWDEVADECLKKRALIDVEHEDYMKSKVARIVAFSPIPSNGIVPSAPLAQEPPLTEGEPF